MPALSPSNVRHTVPVILAAAGSLVTLAGVIACFLFGLIPILRAINTNRAVSIFVGLFLTGVATGILGLRNLLRSDQETWIHDETTRTWAKVS
jgi:hypothetical protein